MGAINHAFNQAGWSILHLANAASKYRSKLNEEGQNRAKQSYSTAATIKKQNNELTKNHIEQVTEKKVPQRFGELAGVEETFKQAGAPTEKEVVEAKKPVQSFGELAGVEEAPAPEQKYISSEEGGGLPTVSAEHSETNIDAKDPEVQGLIEVKQKNALRAAAGQRSQKRYQNIKERLTYRFADEHNIDDVWRNISLDPDITDEMIKKAGFTKAQILEEWKNFKDSPTDWMQRQNIRGEEYGAVGSVAESDDLSNFDFGGTLSTYIRAKAGGKTLAQQQEEYELSKAEEGPEEENYKVWQDDSTEVKTDRNFSGFIWLNDSQYDSTEKEKEEEKDEVKTDRNFSGIKF